MIRMLVRISCGSCGLGALWTDDPHGFLRTVCRRRDRCRAIEGAQQRRKGPRRMDGEASAASEPDEDAGFLALGREEAG